MGKSDASHLCRVKRAGKSDDAHWLQSQVGGEDLTILIGAESDRRENLSLLFSVLSDRREICHFLLLQSKMRENLTL